MEKCDSNNSNLRCLSQPHRGSFAVLLVVIAAGLSSTHPTYAADPLLGSIPKREEPADLSTEAFGVGIYGHEKTYFALGMRDQLDARFQFSLKARLWDHVFFGYSQTSLWDLDSPSRPFQDSSYRPALLFHKRDIADVLGGSLVLSAGLEHESNGRDGPQSRSINIAFLKPFLHIGDEQTGRWRIGAKLYTYLTKEYTNDDIQRYRGYGDYTVAYGQSDGLEISGMVRVGTDTSKSSLLLDLAYPVNRVIGNAPGDFFVQVFAGYGETLLDYNIRREPQIRVGYQLWRER